MFTETETRTHFVDEFLRIMGWDVSNENGYFGSAVEVALERTVSADSGELSRPDYLCRINGIDRVPIEAKKASVQLAGNIVAATQARSYGWTLSLPMSVLTNFSETIIFDTRSLPVSEVSADYGVIPGCRWTFNDYLEDFDNVWDRLSYESVSTDRFESLYGSGRSNRGTSEFDESFLHSFRNWRRILATEIHQQNHHLLEAEVGRRTQRILNALLFLRVCEDRNILKYKDLFVAANNQNILSMFKWQDKIFNAGIFKALDEISIRDEVLIEIVKDLYWPRSKFAFGLIKPDMLSSIYEQYLGEQVIFIGDGEVDLVQKPEVVHAGGVARTPQLVVDRLVDPAIDQQLDLGVECPKILDPATGSGVFLLTAFRRLLEQAAMDRGRPLSLEERSKIATEQLFGIDIDGAAVEVAKLSIQLAILGDQQFDVTNTHQVLPSLDKNIVAGNFIVREDFDRLLPTWAKEVDVRAQTAPLDVARAFGTKFPENGFDIIASNPPYIRIQTLAEHFPAQLAYLQHEDSGYSAAKSGSFDVYQIFMERAFQLMSTSGSLCFIIPNRFITSAAASFVRGLLAERLQSLTHFGTEQVFEERTTYTALIYCGPETNNPLKVKRVESIQDWYADPSCVSSFSIGRKDLGYGPWQIANEAENSLFRQMEDAAVSLLSEEADVFVGVQSSADEVFFLKDVQDCREDERLVKFTGLNGERGRIERDILRPGIKDVPISLLDGQPTPDRWAIFPYAIVEPPTGNRRARLLSREELSLRYPYALKYLDRHRSVLEKRSISPNPGDSFWAYGRSQSLTKLDEPKLVVRVLSTSPSYAFDSEGLVIPGGGDGGPYYLIRPKEHSAYSIEVLQGILSHPVVDHFVTVLGKSYRGSYAVHRKAFLVKIPLPYLDEMEQHAIAAGVVECREISVRQRTESDTRVLASAKDRKLFLYGEINSIITAAYGLPEGIVEAL
ncbi:Eco57I restriction-modification methylase domain-containing protein [Flaviflexus ciconiae]|uniref:Eco57I restriction-modification methylase domain-containing protein n=1 Tax=Flaviflexus ciconiae TaxID=2496867 RepID=UPI0013DF352B|nr:DNA methyltransferase [Flaviflexus ciconiae]